ALFHAKLVEFSAVPRLGLGYGRFANRVARMANVPFTMACCGHAAVVTTPHHAYNQRKHRNSNYLCNHHVTNGAEDPPPFSLYACALSLQLRSRGNGFSRSRRPRRRLELRRAHRGAPAVFCPLGV